MSPTDAPGSPRSISVTRSACSIRINVALPVLAVGVLISAEVRAAQEPLARTSATSAIRASSRDNRSIVVLHMPGEWPQDTAGTLILHGRVRVHEPPSGWQRFRSGHLAARESRLLTHNAGAADSAVALPVVDWSPAR